MGQKTTLKNQRSNTPSFVAKKQEEEAKKTTKSKTQTKETERRVEKTLVPSSNNSVCVLTRFCFSQREHTKTDREEIFISSKRDEHGRRRGGKVEDPDCLLSRRFKTKTTSFAKKKSNDDSDDGEPGGGSSQHEQVQQQQHPRVLTKCPV